MASIAVTTGRAIRVESLDRPELAIYRSVRDPELLREHGVFMAESREVVRKLVLQSRFVPRSVLVTDAALEGMGDILEQLPEPVPVFVATRAVINEVVGFDIHRGCLAACDRDATLAPEDVTAGATDEPGIWVGLASVSNPDNTGGIFRNAVAFGARGVLLDPPSTDPLYRKSIRTSLGSTLTLPFAWVDVGWSRGFELCRARGITVVALTPDPTAVPLHELGASTPMPPRSLLLLGNEGLGLEADLLAGADLCVRIAMQDGFDSINVAAASAVALHHFARGRRAPMR